MHKSLTFKKLEKAVRNSSYGTGGSAYVGFCVKCGTKHTGVEPDARKYECKKCHEHAVYGAEEIYLRAVFR